MKTMRNISLIAAALAVLATGSASAATWTYTSTGPASSDVVTGLTATASAYSAANNTTATITATTAYYGGGLGVFTSGVDPLNSSGNPTAPNHAIDNNGAIETVMLSFSNGVGGITSADKVNLTSASFGWSSTDADFSVYAYTGTATPTVLGLTYSNLTSNGWSLIGHYNNAASSTAKTVTFTNTVYSSNWLIGAYNGLTTTSGANSGNDYFKLASVKGYKCPTTGTIPAGCNGGGTPGGVPEPGTLLLMGAGLLGLTRMSRRKSA